MGVALSFQHHQDEDDDCQEKNEEFDNSFLRLEVSRVDDKDRG